MTGMNVNNMHLEVDHITHMSLSNNVKRSIAMTLLITSSQQVNADTIDTSGQAPYESCGYCHEYDGNSVMAGYPKLAAQTEQYLVKQLQDFKSGKRQSVMQATAELLSAEDIQVVASY